MTDPAARALRRLWRLRDAHGGDAAAGKRACLAALRAARLRRAAEILRLHEALCFLRAYPDDRAVLAAVERMLRAFPRRTDLRRHRAALADSGSRPPSPQSAADQSAADLVGPAGGAIHSAHGGEACAG